MPLLTDETLVNFADRQALLDHVIRRGRTRRRRALQLRFAAATLAVSAAFAPVALVTSDQATGVHVTPPAGGSAPAPGKGSATTAGLPERSAPVDSEGSTAGPTADTPMDEARPQTPQPSAAPISASSTTRPTHARSSCDVTQAGAGDAAVFSGSGPSPCRFTARGAGGYDATGNWEIIVSRGTSVITYASEKGSPECGPNGTFQRGDDVEVRVEQGRVRAGPSNGCS